MPEKYSDSKVYQEKYLMNKGFKQLALILLVVMLAVMIFTLDPEKIRKPKNLDIMNFFSM